MNWLVRGIILLVAVLRYVNCINSAWRWDCIKGSCQKRQITNQTLDAALSLPACQLFCSDAAALWPKPTGDISVGNFLAKINLHSIDIDRGNSETAIFELVLAASKNFKQQIEQLVPKKINPTGGKSLLVSLHILDPTVTDLSLDTDESYSLKVSETSDGRISAKIHAATFFGVRHGLQTLNQLVIFDDIRGELQMPRDVQITDKPAYPYRGILLDTSRNYVKVDRIKRTLEAMAAAKLNTFHWHITDSHSFPYVSRSRPELSRLGAYSTDKVYDRDDVAEIVRYGKERGIRVLPEFDAPAHVGEGWQNTGLVTCFNWQPWQDYCVEPPCGQFDPTNPVLYDVLEDIYGDMSEQFHPDMFHMGGDEVNFNCWNNTEKIVRWMKNQGWGTTEADFIKLWNHFQNNALERVYKKFGKQLPVIMWTSHLTHKEYLIDSLPKDKYIVQIWTKGDDEQVKNLLENGYRVILSNYEALYLDCGFAGWVTDGNNWCSPYIGWQKIYENKPVKIAGERKRQVLGSEATLWTEQADSSSLDGRLWPRASAMAEVLWTEPTTSWRDAEQRILIHRERLERLGIDAEALEPEWCMQNEENCPIGGKFNVPNRGH